MAHMYQLSNKKKCFRCVFESHKILKIQIKRHLWRTDAITLVFEYPQPVVITGNLWKNLSVLRKLCSVWS